MEREFSLDRVDRMPPFSYSFSTTLMNKTGTWRYLRPYFAPKLPPCGGACPLRVEVETVLRLAGEGKFAEAYQVLVQDNPLPGLCGHLCGRPCEGQCLRAQFDEPLSIRALERFLADQAPDFKPQIEKTQEEVAIVGSGPAGLSCAYHLLRLGYRPVVYEAQPVPGGMPRLAVPHYRLPPEVVEKEVGRLSSWGVEIRTGVRVGQDLSLEDLLGWYPAVFLAAGAGRDRELEVPGRDLKGVLPGLGFLMQVKRGERVELGREVVVLGEGYLAIDVARSARRLGAQRVVVCYPGSRQEAPAEEVAEAEAEGVEFLWGVSPRKILGQEGKVSGVELEDSSGVVRELTAQTVISALGRDPDLSFLPQFELDPQTGATEHKGLFVGGDLVARVRGVAEAIGWGKRAAQAIDRYLRDEGVKPLEEIPLAKFSQLNLDRIEHRGRVQQPHLSPEEAVLGFGEVLLGLNQDEALQEARRCLHCGTCTGCDLCFILCPDLSVHKVNGGYEIDYEYCKGCAVCVVECPTGVLSLKEEEGE